MTVLWKQVKHTHKHTDAHFLWKTALKANQSHQCFDPGLLWRSQISQSIMVWSPFFSDCILTVSMMARCILIAHGGCWEMLCKMIPGGVIKYVLLPACSCALFACVCHWRRQSTSISGRFRSVNYMPLKCTSLLKLIWYCCNCMLFLLVWR